MEGWFSFVSNKKRLWVFLIVGAIASILEVVLHVVISEGVRESYKSVFSNVSYVLMLLIVIVGRGFFYGFLALFSRANMEKAIKNGKLKIKKTNENFFVAWIVFIFCLFLGVLTLPLGSVIIRTFLFTVAIFFVLEVAGFAEKFFKIDSGN